jgi:hypothetical protein
MPMHITPRNIVIPINIVGSTFEAINNIHSFVAQITNEIALNICFSAESLTNSQNDDEVVSR